MKLFASVQYVVFADIKQEREEITSLLVRSCVGRCAKV